jgi:hypothetical protein
MSNMPRTLITLDPDDKAWLMRKARIEGTPMTELVRRAVRQFRKQSGPGTSDFDKLLEQTAGLWPHGDGLAYQKRMRSDWGRHE